MSLKRNESGERKILVNDTPEVTSVQVYPPPEQTPLTMPREEISRLWKQITMLKSQDRQSAEDKFQVTLLFATMEQICAELTDFMNATESEIKQMKTHQMRLLNLQKQYKEEIAAEAGKIIGDTYRSIEKGQQKVFENIQITTKNAVKEMTADLQKSARECVKTKELVVESCEEIRSVQNLNDILFYAAPILVFIDVAIRVIQLFLK